jgi:hypothetical protein
MRNIMEKKRYKKQMQEYMISRKGNFVMSWHQFLIFISPFLFILCCTSKIKLSKTTMQIMRNHFLFLRLLCSTVHD